MNKDANPTQYITYMEDLRIRLQSSGQKMSDMQFIMQIINTLPKEYESSVEQIERDMSTIDIGKVRDLLFLKFHRLYPDKEASIAKDGHETALLAGNTFKGKCNKCGKFGHKAWKCREGGSNSSNDASNNNNIKKNNT